MKARVAGSAAAKGVFPEPEIWNSLDLNAIPYVHFSIPSKPQVRIPSVGGLHRFEAVISLLELLRFQRRTRGGSLLSALGLSHMLRNDVSSCNAFQSMWLGEVHVTVC